MGSETVVDGPQSQVDVPIFLFVREKPIVDVQTPQRFWWESKLLNDPEVLNNFR